MSWLMCWSEPKSCLTVMSSKFLGLLGMAGQAKGDLQWGCMDLDKTPLHPHQGWPSGHSHFTGEEASVEFQCHTRETLTTTLLNPCPPHPVSLSISIHYVPIYSPLLFRPPLSSSCHLMAQCAPRPSVLCFTAVNVTCLTLSLLFTECALFSHHLKKTPACISCFLFFLKRVKGHFSSLSSIKYCRRHTITPIYFCECQILFSHCFETG